MRTEKGMFALLFATALLCGALMMVIEVLGSRVIGPFFGVSIFVWMSLITVTMIALAAAYAIGGWLADHEQGAREILRGGVFAPTILTPLRPR